MADDTNPPRGGDRHRVADGLVVARAAAVNVVGMLARGSRALALVFITRVSGPATFGLFTLAISTAEVATRLTVFGLDKSLMTFVPERREKDPAGVPGVLATAVRVGAVLAGLATLLLLVTAPWVSSRWLDAPEISVPVRVVALAIPPLTLATLALAATKALKIMRYDAFVMGLLMPLSLLVFAIPILWTDDDLLTLAVAYSVSGLLTFTAATWAFARHFPVAEVLRARPDSSARRLLRFTAPLGLHDFVQAVAVKLELFLLLLFLTPAELGVYALASEIAGVMKKIRQSFDPILIPLVAETAASGDRERAREQVRSVIRRILTLCAPFAGAMLLLGAPTLALFGGGFSAGASALALLCAAQLLNVLTGPLDLAMMVSGRPHINLFNICLLLVVQTGLNLVLIPPYGIVGGAAAAVGAFAILAGVRLAQAEAVLRLRPFTSEHLKPVVATGLAVAAVWAAARPLGGIPGAWALPAAVAYVAAYVVAMGALGVPEEDLEVWRRLRGALRRS